MLLKGLLIVIVFICPIEAVQERPVFELRAVRTHEGVADTPVRPDGRVITI